MTEWLIDSAKFYRLHWWALLSFIVPIATLRNFLLYQMGWFSSVSENLQIPENFAWMALVFVVFEIVLQLGLIYTIQGILTSNVKGAGYNLLMALTTFPHFLLLQLAMIIAVSGGLMLLIIPGVFLLVRWSLASYFFVLQKSNVVWALQQSWDASRGYGWDLFFGLVVLALISMIPGTIASTAGVSVNGVNGAVINLLATCIGGFSVIFYYRAYDYVQANPRVIDTD